MRRILLPLLALVMGLSLVNAAPAAAGDIASTIRDRYASLNTFQAEFTQYLKHRESGQQEKRQGTLIFKKPLLVNWQTRAPHAESLIISADEIWDYLPEEKVAYRYPHSLVDDSRSLIQIVTGQALLSKDFDVKDGGTQGALQILRLYPKNPSPQMIPADLYVDPVKGYIQTRAGRQPSPQLEQEYKKPRPAPRAEKRASRRISGRLFSFTRKRRGAYSLGALSSYSFLSSSMSSCTVVILLMR